MRHGGYGNCYPFSDPGVHSVNTNTLCYSNFAASSASNPRCYSDFRRFRKSNGGCNSNYGTCSIAAYNCPSDFDISLNSDCYGFPNADAYGCSNSSNYSDPSA